ESIITRCSEDKFEKSCKKMQNSTSNSFLANNSRDALWLTVVAMLWGCTNPLLKRGGEGIENIKKKSAVSQFLAELVFMVCNVKYIVPFLINQSGSLLYYITLGSADLSLAVPITNSLTFLFTMLSGKLLGEEIGSKETYLGGHFGFSVLKSSLSRLVYRFPAKPFDGFI
ncbi:unnamed protein product, partial [Owenia fusiformis]